MFTPNVLLNVSSAGFDGVDGAVLSLPQALSSVATAVSGMSRARRAPERARTAPGGKNGSVRVTVVGGKGSKMREMSCRPLWSMLTAPEACGKRRRRQQRTGRPRVARWASRRTARQAHRRRGSGRAVARSPVRARQGTGTYTQLTPIGIPIPPWDAAVIGECDAADTCLGQRDRAIGTHSVQVVHYWRCYRSLDRSDITSLRAASPRYASPPN